MLIESFHLSGQTFRFRLIVQELEVFLVGFVFSSGRVHMSTQTWSRWVSSVSVCLLTRGDASRSPVAMLGMYLSTRLVYLHVKQTTTTTTTEARVSLISHNNGGIFTTESQSKMSWYSLVQRQDRVSVAYALGWPPVICDHFIYKDLNFCHHNRRFPSSISPLFQSES